MVSKVTTIAVSTAVDVDGDVVQQITSEDSPAYKEVSSRLRKFREANRRKNVFVNYIFIVKPNPNTQNDFIFVARDSTDENFAAYGEDSPGSSKNLLQKHLFEPYSSGKLTKTAYGLSLSGYAPIYNSQGQYVATISANISAEDVNHALNVLYLHAISAFIVSFVLSMLAAAFLAKQAAIALEKLKKATVEIAKPNFAYRIHLNTNDEFEDLANSLNHMCEGLQEKERLKVGFAHYVSNFVLEKIVAAKGATKLEGEKRKVTVLFSDIRGFTHMAEQMVPEAVVGLLNEYFQIMIDIIFKYNGMLDKLIGDGIMAEFGAPVDDPDQEMNAVITAKEMYQQLLLLRKKWISEGKPEIDIGIGVHTGEAIVGSIGSEKRMEYTAIGDTVNIASRLEVISKERHVPIVISESTYHAVKDRIRCEGLGSATLPGRDQPINVYAVLLD